MLRRFPRLLLAAVAVIATGSEANAAQHFIQTYIDAQGGCGSNAAAPLSFVLAGGGLQTPFGKPAGEWTDDDLAALPRILAECEKAAAGVNSFRASEIRGEARNLEARVPRLVQAARVEQARQATQLQARREIAQSRISAAREQAERGSAAADAEVRQLEAEADRAEADTRQAVQAGSQASRRPQDRTAGVDAPPSIGDRDASSCPWSEQDRKSRPEISCQKLTEQFLLGLRGAKRNGVEQAIKAVGKRINEDGLHFISAYQDEDVKGGSGIANFEFENGEVILITASIDAKDRPHSRFMWNGRTGFSCSDLGSSSRTCD